MRTLWPFMLVIGLASCQTADFAKNSGVVPGVGTLSPDSEPLTVLSMTGGLCLVAGMALLVITSGKKGWFPSVGGIILVVLNFLVSRYSDLIFYPLVTCTGLISAAWTYKTIRTLLKEKKAS